MERGITHPQFSAVICCNGRHARGYGVALSAFIALLVCVASPPFHVAVSGEKCRLGQRSFGCVPSSMLLSPPVPKANDGHVLTLDRVSYFQPGKEKRLMILPA